jgi:hypothetical protein
VSLRDDLVPVVDESRALVEELGFRPYVVKTRQRTWSGAEVGRGTATDVDTTLDPAPKVQDVPERLVHGSPGRYESGDRLVTRISATYTRAQLDGGSLAANVEWMWLIDGVEYAVIGEPEERPLEWRVQLRRRNRKRS